MQNTHVLNDNGVGIYPVEIVNEFFCFAQLVVVQYGVESCVNTDVVSVCKLDEFGNIACGVACRSTRTETRGADIHGIRTM